MLTQVPTLGRVTVLMNNDCREKGRTKTGLAGACPVGATLQD